VERSFELSRSNSRVCDCNLQLWPIRLESRTVGTLGDASHRVRVPLPIQPCLSTGSHWLSVGESEGLGTPSHSASNPHGYKVSLNVGFVVQR
jgi:hypothetical protein